MAGFEAMGSTQRLRVIEDAVALFGPKGPSEEHRERQDQLGKLYQKNDTIFDELDTQYYKSDEEMHLLVARFVLAHPESFR